MAKLRAFIRDPERSTATELCWIDNPDRGSNEEDERSVFFYDRQEAHDFARTILKNLDVLPFEAATTSGGWAPVEPRREYWVMEILHKSDPPMWIEKLRVESGSGRLPIMFDGDWPGGLQARMRKVTE